MAKAQLTLQSGTKVVIEGSEEEVAKLLLLVDGPKMAPVKTSEKSLPKKSGFAKTSLSDLIGNLVDEGFFKKPTDLNSVKDALKQQGHYFARSAVPTQLLRLVKRRQLRRIKEDGQWRYVG